MGKLKYHIIIEGNKYPDFHTAVVMISIKCNFEKINILFDAGFYYDAELIQKNLQLKTKSIDYIVISHWHIDHCGGLVLLNEDIFSNSYIIISTESINVILKALKLIEEASYYKHPVLKLTDLLIENKNFFGWTDKIEYPKVRALANLTYRTYDCWLKIYKRFDEKKVYVIKDSEKNIFSYLSSIKLLKISYHTEGDLMLILDNEREKLLVSGDVIPYKSYQKGISTLFDLERNCSNQKGLLENILKEVDLIIPSHGRPFYNEKNS